MSRHQPSSRLPDPEDDRAIEEHRAAQLRCRECSGGHDGECEHCYGTGSKLTQVQLNNYRSMAHERAEENGDKCPNLVGECPECNPKLFTET